MKVKTYLIINALSIFALGSLLNAQDNQPSENANKAAGTTASAAEVPASAASIKEVLSVTDVKAMLDKMWPQIDAMMSTQIQQCLKGQVLSANQQEALNQMRGKMIASMKDELSWEKMEPLYIEVYQKSFTQDEIDGMLAFYKSPAGAAVVKKLPVVMQETMIAMQQRIGPMMQRMQKDTQESVGKLKEQGIK